MYTDIACVAAPRICPPGARAKMPINSCASPKVIAPGHRGGEAVPAALNIIVLDSFSPHPPK
jgi:hypothetical protein